MLSFRVCGQILEPQSIKINEEQKLEYQITKIEKEINKQEFEKESKTHKAEFVRIKVKSIHIQIIKNKAIAICYITYNNWNNDIVLKR